MTSFEFEVVLVSELIEYSSSPDTQFSDPFESFGYNFRNYGGTELLYDASPCLKDGVNSLPQENSFVGLEWDSEIERFEGSIPNYEIETVTGDQDVGWEYSYHLLVSFSAQVLTATLEEAIAKVRTEVLENLAIYDGGIDEIVEVEEVRIIHNSKNYGRAF